MDSPQTNEHEVISWLHQNAIPLRHLEAGNGFADLQPLKQILADVRIVGLGEATHGTREFFQVKHRLLEFLVTELGFTAFAIEASYAACQPINDYIVHGKGDRAAVLTGQHYVVWDTEEFSAMLDWLRAHNQDVPEARKVRFYGLDLTYNGNGHRAVLEYLGQVAPERVNATAVLFQVLAQEEVKWPTRIDEESEATVAQILPELRGLIVYLSENRDELASRSSAEALDRTLQFARVMLQWWSGGKAGRSRHMAENLLHVLDREHTGTKVVVWAHNAHVGVATPWDGEPSLGYVLRERYGDAYFACALEFNEGSYQMRTVLPDGVLADLREAALPPASEGSFPWYLAHADVGNYIVSLRTPTVNPLVEQWLTTSRPQHAIGWPYEDPSTCYEPVTVGEQYDGVVFIDRTTPTRPTALALETVARREGL